VQSELTNEILLLQIPQIFTFNPDRRFVGLSVFPFCWVFGWRLCNQFQSLDQRNLWYADGCVVQRCHQIKKVRRKINYTMKKNKFVIDVRTPAEFAGGHVVGSVNIPLQKIPQRVDEIKAMQGDIILCCASGNRSAQATVYLRSLGVNCNNGGSWFDVNFELNKNQYHAPIF
jgi:rhodanese-related sulfurtransferase